MTECRLAALAAEIGTEHAALEQASADLGQRMLALGHKLGEARQLVKLGQWQPWLVHTGTSAVMARRYMTLFPSRSRRAVWRRSAHVGLPPNVIRLKRPRR
jgi:hypothetical protein